MHTRHLKEFTALSNLKHDVDSKFTILNTKLDSQFSNLRQDIEGMKVDITKMEHDLRMGFARVKSDISDQKGDISDLKSNISDLKSDISDLKFAMSDLKSTIYWEVSEPAWVVLCIVICVSMFGIPYLMMHR